MSLHRLFVALTVVCVLTACGKKTDDGGGGSFTPTRCEVDLAALGLTASNGSDALATATTITDPGQLIGGQVAEGQLGDTLLSNDKIRVVIQKPARNIGPNPYGGNIIDADLQRQGPGKDQFGKVGLVYSFGRTIASRTVDILADGTLGGPAVVAVTGEDTVNDFVNVQNLMGRLLGAGSKFVVDPEKQVPARITTYYVLAPNEQRVRMLTAFCNDSASIVNAPVGDLVDRGGTVELFNPGECEQTMGTAESCFVDPSPWFGYQGEDVAYGFRSYRTDDLTKVENQNALLTVAGVSVTLTGGQNTAGLLSWIDATATRRPGSFNIPAGGQKLLLRDFIVGRDLGEVKQIVAVNELGADGTAPLNVSIKDGAGQPFPGARAAVLDGSGAMVTLLVADASGKSTTRLAPGQYSVVAGLLGYAASAPTEVSLTHTGADLQLTLSQTHKLTVNITDPSGAPSPGKVSVLCAGSCPTTMTMQRRFHENEVLPDNVAAQFFVAASGTGVIQVPPGNYQVLVTRGPEYTAWPASWPTSGAAVDLTASDQTVNATVAHVIDTSGWMSADLHVHSVNSPDSALKNELRVVNFAADGVDVLCSTDHDYITDFAPFVQSTGSQNVLASMVGLEITPFDWGHYNSYPVLPIPTPNRGAFDWAGGEGPTLRQGQMIQGVNATWPDAVVQMNHPRGMLGSLTLLHVDTPTLATHASPTDFRMEPAPEATPNDSALFTDRFDAMEIMNGSDLTRAHVVMNDWFTFLSRGTVKTGTATSDTHYAFKNQGGYPRTFVDMGGRDTPAQFDSKIFAQGIKAHHAFGTNGPVIHVSAQRLVSAAPTGPVVQMGDTLSVSAGDQVQISVDVQAPDWMTVDTVELYTHAAGRESYDGQDNADWPDSRIAATHALPVSTTPLEPVVVSGGTFQKRHYIDTFTVSPTADTWYVVLVRGAAPGQSLFPLTFETTCSGGTCTAVGGQPLAFSNPILIDADGSGKYDQFPLVLNPPSPRSRTFARPPLTYDELVAALTRLAHAH